MKVSINKKTRPAIFHCIIDSYLITNKNFVNVFMKKNIVIMERCIFYSIDIHTLTIINIESFLQKRFKHKNNYNFVIKTSNLKHICT